MTKDKQKKQKKNISALGIDYGKINIGLAIGQNGFVEPLAVIPAKDNSAAINQIANFIATNKLDYIAMGLPLTAEEKDTKESIEVRRFAKLLAGRLNKKIHFVNEYGSSSEALIEAISLNRSKKNRKSNDDIAAAIILKRFFEETEF